MKLSLAWIFDHIDADWTSQDVDHLVTQFNKVTAEIEDFYRLSFDLSHFFLGSIGSATAQHVECTIPELNTTITLAGRPDVTSSQPEGYFLLKRESDHFTWATLADFGVEKEGYVPALDCAPGEIIGVWRTKFEANDVIIEIDNKSITHRPDMWGHRGFAREIAAFLNLPLHPKERFCKQLPILSFEKTSQPTQSNSVVIENLVPQGCSRFAGIYFSSIKNKPTPLLMASRLMKIGARPMNAIVDCANYLMNDWSQPMHTYDAAKIGGNRIVVRMAHLGEKLDLLDGNSIELSTHDMVIADDKKPLCLAGVKGGLDSGISPDTRTIFLESATFDAGMVRRTAQRHKLRTDSSARFEKTLDQNQTVDALQRFIKLLEEFGVAATYSQEVISVGKEAAPCVIEVTHEFLEQRMGVAIPSSTLINVLSGLEFQVLKSTNEEKKTVYIINVPSFRSSKDIKIKEDILEEVVRCYGFDKIPLQLPSLVRTPFSFTKATRTRAVKSFLAHAAHMIEQQNYSMVDEQFIATLGLKVQEAVSIINPVSENYRRMVTSLVPGLLRNIVDNHMHRDQLALFECGRVWHRGEEKPAEKNSIAGIFFTKRAAVNFYKAKYYVVQLFGSLGFGAVEWKKATEKTEQWYRPYQTAQLMIGDCQVGIAGKADPVLLSKLGIDVTCDAFIFELDGNFLFNEACPLPAYKQLSKFQETYVDLSLVVPRAVEFAQLHNSLKGIDQLVSKVEIVDFFEKDDVPDTRCITMRLWMVSDEKTLEKSEIDAVWKKAATAVEPFGVTVRMQ